MSKDSNGAHYLSKEASTTRGPRLLVVPGDPASDAGPIGDSDPKPDGGALDGSPGGDASGVDAKTGDARPSDDLDRGDVNGGCGCRTTRGRTSTPCLVALGLVVGLAMSRRRLRSQADRARKALNDGALPQT